jgi:hypothetical protein
MALSNAKNTVAHCTRSRQFSYELEWVPEQHYVPGTVFELRSHCIRTFSDWTWARLEMEKADLVYRWKINPSVSEMWTNPERVIFRAKLVYGVRQGEKVRLKLTAIPSAWAGVDETLSVWTREVPPVWAAADAPPVVAEKEAGSECTLRVTAGPVERLSIYSRPMPGRDGKVRTVLVPEDRFGNPAELVKPISADLSWEDETWPVEISGPQTLYLERPAGTARLTAVIAAGELGPEDNVANGLHADGKITLTGNPVWPEPVDELQAAFGEFHWHTAISGDGYRSMQQALASARDYLNMDYAAPGDHNPRGADWQETVSALDEANDLGNFATFYGWENGTDQGHENYYFTDPEHPVVCGGSAGVIAERPDKVLDRLAGYEGFFAVAHHTNAVAETRRIEDDAPYWHPYPWTRPVEYLRLVEIMQCRGNQERNDYTDDWRGWHQNNRASAQDALARGHKLGFTGGTDNHCGWPGRFDQEEAAGRVPPASVILTGVWTAQVERQSLYEALWQRHTWAVWDTRALIVYRVNDVLMGGELQAAPGTELGAYIKLSAEDALQSVEIVSEGKTVWCGTFADMDLEVTVPLGRAEKSTHFYLRALQRNGGIIYASPVFVEVV